MDLYSLNLKERRSCLNSLAKLSAPCTQRNTVSHLFVAAMTTCMHNTLQLLTTSLLQLSDVHAASPKKSVTRILTRHVTYVGTRMEEEHSRTVLLFHIQATHRSHLHMLLYPLFVLIEYLQATTVIVIIRYQQQRPLVALSVSKEVVCANLHMKLMHTRAKKFLGTSPVLPWYNRPTPERKP